MDALFGLLRNEFTHNIASTIRKFFPYENDDVKKMTKFGLPYDYLNGNFDIKRVLYNACLNGLEWVVSKVIDARIDVAWRDNALKSIMGSNMMNIEEFIDPSLTLCCLWACLACRANSLKIVELLATRSILDMNTILHEACLYEYLEIPKYTINNGAAVSDSNIHRAVDVGNLKLAEFLIENCEEEIDKGFDAMCNNGYLNIAKYTVEHGTIDLNNCLRTACYYGYFELVEIIIKKGANDMNSGLEGACCSRNVKMAEFVISIGATNLDKGLYEACRNGNFEMVKLMVEKGATNFSEALEGALCHIWKNSSDDIIAFIIKCGATNALELYNYFVERELDIQAEALLKYL